MCFKKTKHGQFFRKTNISFVSFLLFVHFRKIWRALFSWNTRSEICPFALLLTILHILSQTEVEVRKIVFIYLIWKKRILTLQYIFNNIRNSNINHSVLFLPEPRNHVLLIQKSCASYSILGSSPRFICSAKLQWPSLAFFGSKCKIDDFERLRERKTIFITSKIWIVNVCQSERGNEKYCFSFNFSSTILLASGK